MPTKNIGASRVIVTPTKERPEEGVADIFSRFDTHGTGKIGRDELEVALRLAAPSTPVTKACVDEIFFEHDMDRDEQLNLPEFTVAVSRLVTKSVAHSKGKGALSATEKLFLDAVKIHRSELGKVVDNQGYYFKRLVPLVYFCLVVISIYARYFDSSALINEASSAFFGPGAWHVRCALGAAAFSTVVAGQQALNHLSRAVDSSAPLVVTIVCLCPVYAWASAIKLLLPGQVFGLHRHVSAQTQSLAMRHRFTRAPLPSGARRGEGGVRGRSAQRPPQAHVRAAALRVFGAPSRRPLRHPLGTSMAGS